MEYRPAQDLLSRAQSLLSASPIYALRDLRVEQNNGTLLITGSVASFYQKQLAQEVVRAIATGVELRNTVTVLGTQTPRNDVN